MTDQRAGTTAAGDHLVLFDGVCALCSGVVQFVLARDRRRRFDFAPLQGTTARAYLERFDADPGALDTFYVITNYRSATPALRSRAAAALFLMSQLGWPWKAAGVFRIVPGAVLNAAYDIVARHRYRMFGRYEQCMLPRPEDRSRFIE